MILPLTGTNFLSKTTTLGKKGTCANCVPERRPPVDSVRFALSGPSPCPCPGVDTPPGAFKDVLSQDEFYNCLMELDDVLKDMRRLVRHYKSPKKEKKDQA